MTINQLKSSGKIANISSCLSVSESKFISSFEKTMRYCANKHGFGPSSEQLMNTCFANKGKENLGVSGSTYAKCEKQAANEESEIANNDNYSDLPDQQLKNLVEKQQAESRKNLKAMTNMLQSKSQGTENFVTLPIYSPSKIVSHYTEGMIYGTNKRTLPVATFVSSDSIEKVVAFYKKSLPNFKVDHGQGNMYTFMKNIPDNLYELSMDLENLPLYSIPHVEVYEMKTDGQQKTNIVIIYQK